MTASPPRGLLLVLVAVLAWLAVDEYRRLERRLAELTVALAEAGVAGRHPQATADLRRLPGRTRSALRAARVLLADELERGIRPDPQAPLDPRQSLERLRLARRLAAETISVEPANWQAWMVLGGARYLELSRRADPRLGAERQLWLQPLERSRRLAPGQPEPVRLLAAAYLSHWSSLSDGQRTRAAAVVREAMGDPQSFALLVEIWLRVAPSREEAFAAIPERPESWGTVQAHYARIDDWERYCQARDRWLETLSATVGERLAAPDTDPKTSRRGRAASRLLGLVASLPPDPRFAPLIERALASLPEAEWIAPNPKAFRPWMEWTLVRCALDRCPFPATVLARLATAAGELQPVEEALVAWVRGDHRTALDAEARNEAADPQAWSLFRLVRARTEGTSPAAEGEGSSSAWGAAAWRRDGRRWSLGPIRTPAAEAIRIRIGGDGASAVVASWDGVERGCHPVRGGGSLELRVPVEPGHHHLLLDRVDGRDLVPGEVSARPASREAPPSP